VSRGERREKPESWGDARILPTPTHQVVFDPDPDPVPDPDRIEALKSHKLLWIE
jgi:hypothetical protein